MRVTRLAPLHLGEADLDKPLAQCPATSIGELSNGLKYFVRSCHKPAGRVVLRLVFRTGSLDEEDDQLGLAHFLEHAAFLKLKSFDKGELIKFLESIGAQFGADLNAHTGFSETVYKLNLPLDATDADGAPLLARAIAIMGEWASGVVVDDAMVETERNVVQEEHRAGLGCSDRLFRAWLHEAAHLYCGFAMNYSPSLLVGVNPSHPQQRRQRGT